MYDKVKEDDTMNTYQTTKLSPFFKSLFSDYPALSENLLTNTFTAEYIQREIEREGDTEKVAEDLLLWIQTNKSAIILLNSETGEIVFELNLTTQNLAKKAEELLPSGSSAFDFAAVQGERENDFDENEIMEFGGYFTSSGCLTYKQNGVRMHKPPFDGFWRSHGTSSAICTGLIENAENGEITDRFFGNCNDFNDWFIGKVARGEKFFVKINRDCSINGKFGIAHEVIAIVGKEKLRFRCDKNGAWRILNN